MAVFVTITFVVGEAAGNLAPVWLFAVTLPWSTLLVASPGLVWHVSLAGLVIAAAVNARLLGALGDHTALGP